MNNTGSDHNEDISQVPATVKKEIENIVTDPKQRKRILQVINSITFYSGPLPSPDFLRQYNEILPGLGERIVTMAEKQSEHRMQLEKIVIPNQVSESRRGQFFGLLIASICIISSFVLAMYGHDVVAGVVGGATVVGLVTVFVYGKKSQERDLRKKP